MLVRTLSLINVYIYLKPSRANHLSIILELNFYSTAYIDKTIKEQHLFSTILSSDHSNNLFYELSEIKSMLKILPMARQ